MSITFCHQAKNIPSISTMLPNQLSSLRILLLLTMPLSQLVHHISRLSHGIPRGFHHSTNYHPTNCFLTKQIVALAACLTSVVLCYSAEHRLSVMLHCTVLMQLNRWHCEDVCQSGWLRPLQCYHQFLVDIHQQQCDNGENPTTRCWALESPLSSDTVIDRK